MLFASVFSASLRRAKFFGYSSAFCFLTQRVLNRFSNGFAGLLVFRAEELFLVVSEQVSEAASAESVTAFRNKSRDHVVCIGVLLLAKPTCKLFKLHSGLIIIINLII